MAKAAVSPGTLALRERAKALAPVRFAGGGVAIVGEDEGYFSEEEIDDPDFPGQRILKSELRRRREQQAMQQQAALSQGEMESAPQHSFVPQAVGENIIDMKAASLGGGIPQAAGFLGQALVPGGLSEKDATQLPIERRADFLAPLVESPEPIRKPFVNAFGAAGEAVGGETGEKIGRGVGEFFSPTPIDLFTLGTSKGVTGILKAATKPEDWLTVFKRSAEKMAAAKATGPEALAAEKARQAAIAKAAETSGDVRHAADEASAQARFSNTGKAEFADTADEMAEAQRILREGGTMHAGVPVEQKNLGGFWENLLAIPNLSKRVQASGDVASAQARQNAPSAFIDPRIWLKNTKRATQSYFEDPDAAGVMDEVVRLPLFSEGDVRRALIVTKPDGTLDAITVKSMEKILGLGDDFATPGFERSAKSSLVSRLGDRYMSFGEFGKRSEKAQTAALMGTATDYYGGMVSSAQKAGVFDQKYYDQYGQIAKIWAGYGDVPQILKGLSQNFYSLRNVAARFQSFFKPITSSGQVFRSPVDMIKDKSIFSASPRGVATQYLTRWIGGEMASLAFLSAAGKRNGLFDVGWNPLEPGFGRLTYEDDKGNDHTVELTGGYGSLIKAAVRTGAWGADTAQGKPSEFNPAVDWLQFTRYKMTAIPGAGIDTLINAAGGDAGKYATDLLDPKNRTPEGLARLLQDAFTPFFSQAPIEMLRTGAVDKTPEGIARFGGELLGGFGGAPLGFEPATASEQAGQAAISTEGMPKTFLAPDGITEKPITTYAELQQADPEAADRWLRENPAEAERLRKEQGDTSQEANKLKAEFFKLQEERDKLLKTNPEQWRRESSTSARELGIRLDQLWAAEGDFKNEPRGLLDVANGKYHDAIEGATNPTTKQVDWDQVDRAVASMSEKERDLLFKSRLAGETPARKTYINDLVKLVPYFEQRDKAWQELTANDPEASQYKSLDDFKQVLVAELHDQGLGWTEAESKIESKLAGLQDKVGKYANAYLAENAEELLPLLDRYDFYVPAKFKKYVRREP